ncbi:MAG: hypothetical protein HY720_24550 [Planctomycetes bacterium]|nr:hypothetical protein [Planctomycetota bacterium]
MRDLILPVRTAALLPSWLLLAGLALTHPLFAQEDEEKRALEERVRELETEVRDLRRLIEEKLGETPRPEGPGAQPSTEESEFGEWTEPEIEKAAEARDPEARRRLAELEASVLKFESERETEKEEEAGKVQFDFSVKYKAQVNSRVNFNLNNPLQRWEFDNETFFDQRYQLQVDARYEQLQATLLLDKGNFVFDWKEDSEGTLERWGQFHLVDAALVRQLYGQYTGDFIVKVGRQNWDIGHAIVLEGPMDSIKFQYPIRDLPWGPTTITAGYMAVSGAWRNYSEFASVATSAGMMTPSGTRRAVFSVTNKLDAFYLDVDIRPERELKLVTYFLGAWDRGGTGAADLNLDKDFDPTTVPRDGSFEPIWVGIAGDADYPWAKIEADAILLTRRFSDDRNLLGYAFRLGASHSFGETGFLEDIVVGAEAGVGSGNEAGDSPTSKFRAFNGLFMCRDRNKFGNIFSEDIRAGYFLWDSNLSNVSYVRGYTTLEPIESLRITPSVARLWTTEEVLKGRGPVYDWSRGTAVSLSRTRDVGWEADLNVNYQFLKHLEGYVELGAFLPGSVYARPNGSDAQPAYEAVVGLEIKF